MAKSFLQRIQPSRERWKMVDWPFPADGDEKHSVRVHVLGEDKIEAAYLAAQDHFKELKRKVEPSDTVFILRERVEIVWRAFSVDGTPIADDADELAEQPLAAIEELHSTWLQFQNDVCAVPHTPKEMDALVGLLKKNMDAARLSALPSSWLIGLVTILASMLPPSTPDSERG